MNLHSRYDLSHTVTMSLTQPQEVSFEVFKRVLEENFCDTRQKPCTDTEECLRWILKNPEHWIRASTELDQRGYMWEYLEFEFPYGVRPYYGTEFEHTVLQDILRTILFEDLVRAMHSKYRQIGFLNGYLSVMVYGHENYPGDPACPARIQLHTHDFIVIQAFSEVCPVDPELLYTFCIKFKECRELLIRDTWLQQLAVRSSADCPKLGWLLAQTKTLSNLLCSDLAGFIQDYLGEP